MVTTIGAHDAQTHLSDYLDRAASQGERIVVERSGTPVAALVSLDDLRRLEQLDQSDAAPITGQNEAAQRERYRRAMAAAGLVVQWPTAQKLPLGWV